MIQASMKYQKGFVVGKFCPLTKGHEYLIRTALASCESLIILSYTSTNFDRCSVANRTYWLNSFISSLNIDSDRVIIKVLGADECPPDDAEPEIHRTFCANYLIHCLETTVNAVFTSEEYGDPFSDALEEYFTAFFGSKHSVDHICVDLKRNTWPISATMIRADDQNLLKDTMLSPYVAETYTKRVLFLGGESSGKSTMTQRMAELYGAHAVQEYGRDHYEKKNHVLEYADMEYIGVVQIKDEIRAGQLTRAKDYLFCDTCPLTTMFYSLELFGRVSTKLSILAHGIAERYEHIYICNTDFDFVQDGTRKDTEFRQKGHEFYQKFLNDMKIPYKILSGTIEQRIKIVQDDLGPN